MNFTNVPSIHLEPTSPTSYGVDLRAEAELLVPHDLTALHARLEGALRRRSLLTALLAGAAALGLAAGAVHLASKPEPPPPPPPVIAPVMAAAPVFVPVDVTPPVPCDIVPPVIVEAAPITRTVIVHAPAPPPDDDAIALEGSRLRAQLRIFDDGERALVGGDPERALSRALHLRERYVNGPLDLDAAILGVRALRAAGRVDEARAALDAVEAHPLAKEKRSVLEELRALLPPPIQIEAPSRVLRVVAPAPVQERAGDERPTAPVVERAIDESHSVPEEDNRPSRVIGAVTP